MKFAGELLDSTGLYDLRAREYDPATGRLLTLDPAGSAGANSPALSSYIYAGDRPTTAVDPSGMTPEASDTAVHSRQLAGSSGCAGISGCTSGGIDRSRVVWYLRHWAHHTNPEYERTYSTSGHENDCTNFISQALLYGGWSETSVWTHTEPVFGCFSGWPGAITQCYSWTKKSVAWVNVRAFIKFATTSGRAAWRSAFDEAMPGDVVTVDFQGGTPGVDWQSDHLEGITKMVGDKIYIASHGADRLDFPLYDYGERDSVMEAARRQGYPHAKAGLLHLR